MKPPPGFAPPSPYLMCKLKKSLSSLGQAPREWYYKSVIALQDYNFKPSPLDHSLFTYHRGEAFLVLLVYVDDLILTGNSPSHYVAFKVYLNDQFKLKDFGSLKYFLGIEVARFPKGLFLCQWKYTLIFSLKQVYTGSNQHCFLWSKSFGS